MSILSRRVGRPAAECMRPGLALRPGSVGLAALALSVSAPALAFYPVAKSDIDLVEPDASLAHPIARFATEAGEADGAQAIEQARGSTAVPGSADTATPAPVPPPQPGSPPQPEDIVVQGSRNTNDPLRGVNQASFELAQSVDKAFFGPFALAYARRIPEPIRNGLRNFFRNLREPVIALAFLLQLHPGKAGETLGRFAINSTIGIGGAFDIAKRKPFHLPFRRNGIADTLGYYGIKQGPYFFLPVFGPTTARDIVGQLLDRLLVPLTVGGPFKNPAFSVPAAVLGALDRRADIDERIETVRAESGDLYASTRNLYLRRRQAEIDGLRGKIKVTEPVAR